MKVKLDNVGILRHAEFETGDITIICGRNNTGKTYATYALYGFLDFWHEGNHTLDIKKEHLRHLYDFGSVRIELEPYRDNAGEILTHASKKYAENINSVFASTESYFQNAMFEFYAKPAAVKETTYEEKIRSIEKKELVTINKKAGEDILEVSLFLEESESNEKPPEYIINDIISDDGVAKTRKTTFSDFFTTPSRMINTQKLNRMAKQ